MIVQNAANTIESNVSNQASFSIKASGKAFRILSDGLYSDKILAVARELSCNAYDSHVEAGKSDVPFYIHLPTVLEPFFSVRDYGVGLNHEGVLDVYTTYFESTKTESNDYIGALGLGSKSPFSYVDTFTINAIKDSVKRVYACFIDDNGVPNVSLLDEDSTKEGNGVEVVLPVNTDDIYSFKEKTEKALEYFKTKPDTNIKLSFDVSDKEPILEGPDWKVFASYNYSSNNNCVAKQGMVGYPIKYQSISCEVPDDVRRIIKNFNIVIDFPLGELEVAASREALSYTEHTSNNIVKRLSGIYASIVDSVEKTINNAKSLYEAISILNKARTDFSLEFNDVKYMGKVIPRGLVLSVEDIPDFISDVHVNYSFSHWSSKRISMLKKLPARKSLTFSPERNNLFVILADTGTRVAKKALYSYIEDNYRSPRESIDVVMITHKDIVNRKSVYTQEVKNDYADVIENNFYGIYDDRVLLLSDIKDSIVVSPREKSETIHTLLWRGHSFDVWGDSGINSHSNNYGRDSWSEHGIDIEDGGYYVPVKGVKIFKDSELIDSPSYNFDKLLKLLRELGAIGDEEIVGVRNKKTIAKFESSDKWESIFDVADEYVNKSHNSVIKKIKKYLSYNDTRSALSNYSDLFSHDNDKVIFRKEFTKKYKNTSFYEMFTKLVVDAFTFSEEYKTMLTLCRMLGVSFEVEEKGTKRYDRILKKYPLIEYFSSHNIENDKNVLAYIKLIERK